jgi:hypothetical protein
LLPYPILDAQGLATYQNDLIKYLVDIGAFDIFGPEDPNLSDKVTLTGVNTTQFFNLIQKLLKSRGYRDSCSISFRTDRLSTGIESVEPNIRLLNTNTMSCKINDTTLICTPIHNQVGEDKIVNIAVQSKFLYGVLSTEDFIVLYYEVGDLELGDAPMQELYCINPVSMNKIIQFLICSSIGFDYCVNSNICYSISGNSEACPFFGDINIIVSRLDAMNQIPFNNIKLPLQNLIPNDIMKPVNIVNQRDTWVNLSLASTPSIIFGVYNAVTVPPKGDVTSTLAIFAFKPMNTSPYPRAVSMMVDSIITAHNDMIQSYSYITENISPLSTPRAIELSRYTLLLLRLTTSPGFVLYSLCKKNILSRMVSLSESIALLRCPQQGIIKWTDVDIDSRSKRVVCRWRYSNPDCPSISSYIHSASILLI